MKISWVLVEVMIYVDVGEQFKCKYMCSFGVKKSDNSGRGGMALCRIFAFGIDFFSSSKRLMSLERNSVRT